MSSPTPDLKQDVHHYWTSSYAIVEGMVGKEVSMDMYQVDRMSRMCDGVSLHKHPCRRMVGYADISGIRRKWTESDDRSLEEDLASLLAVRRVEVAW